jgi:hypothetical protein
MILRFALLLKESEPERRIVHQVLSYFVRNPKAADSLEGVTHWRLLEEQVHRTLQETELALSWLVTQEFLQEIPTSGSARVFRLNPERSKDALRFLQKQKQRQSRTKH